MTNTSRKVLTTSVRQAARVVQRMALEFSALVKIASLSTTCRYATSVATSSPQIVRRRTLAPADARMGDRLCHFRPFGTDVALPGYLFGSAREIYVRQVYFALPQFRLRPQDTVVDLGANHGVFTTLAARMANRVIAIEAQSEFLDIIRKNVSVNESSRKLVTEFALVGGGSGVFADHAQVLAASHYRVEPPRIAVDEIFRRNNVDRVDFMKIDIEGSEFDLLRKDNKWLAVVSKLVMEVHPEFGAPSELVTILSAAGYNTDLRDAALHPATSLSRQGGYLYAWRSEA